MAKQELLQSSMVRAAIQSVIFETRSLRFENYLVLISDAWQRKIEKQKDWFLRDEKISRTNENLRVPTNKPSVFDELEGVQGTFRKLNID